MAIVDVGATSAFGVPLVIGDSIEVVAVDAMVADTVTVDIRCYCRRYCWTEALPSVLVLVMWTPIRLMLSMTAEWAYQIVDSVGGLDRWAYADVVIVEFAVMVWRATSLAGATFVNVVTFEEVAVTFVVIIEEMALDTVDCYPFVELGIAVVAVIVVSMV